MSVPHPTPSTDPAPSSDPIASPSSDPALEPAPPAAVSRPGRPLTRTGATWVGICAAALVAVVLIVFMLQNTRGVEVSFLWMHGSLPLALALLIAAVGSAILVMVVGAARITQLRRQARRAR